MLEQTRSDQGFTIAELLVVVVMFGVILGAVFLGVQALRLSADASQRDAWIASGTADPLLYLERTVSQAVSVANSPNSNANRIQFVTQKIPSGENYQHTIVASGGRLTDTIYLMAGNTPTGAPRVVTIVDGSTTADFPKNANDTSKPLFSYVSYDSSTTVDPSNARSVKAKVWVSYQGQTYSDEKQIFLRNRQR